MAKTLQNVSPRVIQKNPENPRIIFRPAEMEALLRSIDQVGIQVPLSVFQKTNSSKYTLLDGERRWRCSLKLGLKKVPVIIEPEPTPLENLLMMFNIHNVRVNWELIALAEKVQRVRDLINREEGQELTKKELADLTGVTVSTITRCDELLSLPSKYYKMIWKELEKPKSEQKYTEDLFIEINKSIKAINKYLPEIESNYSHNELLDIFFRKYKSEVVVNRVHFRNISKIARGERVGIPKRRVLNVIKKFITNKNYSIEDAFAESVEFAYSIRSMRQKLSDTLLYLKEVDKNEIAEIKPLLIKIRVQISKILSR